MADNDNATPSPSPLVNLPPALREHVYDMLEVRERVVLNAALPRTARIERTLRTNPERDRRLALAWRGFKARRVQSPVIATFIRKAAAEGDPTARAITEGVRAQRAAAAATDGNAASTANAEQAWSGAIGSCCEALVEALERAKSTGQPLTPAAVAAACAPAAACPDPVVALLHMMDNDIGSLQRSFSRCATPLDLDALLSNPVATALIKRFGQRHTALTEPLQNGNAALVRELLVRGLVERAEVNFVCSVNALACFYTSAIFLRAAFESLPLGSGIADMLLGIAVDRLDTNTARMLERDFGARLVPCTNQRA